MANSPSGDSLIARVVRVLETFSAERTVQTASEIGRAAGLPPSTAHRLVDDLAASGLLERDEDQRVRLGMRLWELALRGSPALRLRQAALPHMESVQTRIRQHTQLAVLERDEVLFIERLSHPEAGANIARVAGKLPLHASSAGLVLLAHAEAAVRERVLAGPLRRLGPGTITDPALLRRELAAIRRAGFVVAPGSVEGVSTGVAVPIRDAGAVIAALSVVLPRSGEHAGDADADARSGPGVGPGSGSGSGSDAAVTALQAAARAIEDELRALRSSH
ncbi:IclR family transcriptional regulator [Leucobacter luti]|uniref:IclR family transcriptional regulator n=1 Tax=Leucobacter luti TaxID=340320 RepID=A0A4Q7TZX1_9MICO|nr:IclR family transcriptional regulator [Leucobacter luti]MBL3699203.1 IclR family transcriptional regulator [Leucobacter luti]RZT66701.1 IclR family transcriptional regulator [Leucobacter luti]